MYQVSSGIMHPMAPSTTRRRSLLDGKEAPSCDAERGGPFDSSDTPKESITLYWIQVQRNIYMSYTVANKDSKKYKQQF